METVNILTTLSDEALKSRAAFEGHCRVNALRGAPLSIYGNSYARILGDQIIAIDPDDQNIARWFVSDGFWESWVSLAIARNIKPGDFCLDIGANQGYYTLLMAKQAGPSGTVIGVEANRNLWRLILESLEINRYDENVEAVNMAVSDKSGETVTLHGCEGWDGSSSIISEVGTVGSRYSLEVETVTVDDLVGDQKVDFIKVDIEGAEHKFWKGAWKTLQNENIKIAMEFTPQAYDVEQFIEDIEVLDFRINTILHDGSLAPVDKSKLKSAPANGFYDLFLRR